MPHFPRQNRMLPARRLSARCQTVQSALAEMDQAIEQTRQSRILSGQKLEAPLRMLELVDGYHATAGALQNCGRLIQTLEIQRCWGAFAL
jgi:hypothetical protein